MPNSTGFISDTRLLNNFLLQVSHLFDMLPHLLEKQLQGFFHFLCTEGENRQCKSLS